MRTLEAARIGADAAQRLERAVGSGHVHSVYARTINVRLDGLGETGWLSLHGTGPLPAPFAIACAGALPAPEIRPGAPVRTEPDGLVLGGALRLRLAGARVTDTALPTAAPRPPAEACLRAAGPRGLAPAAAAVLGGTAPPADPLGGLATPALAALRAATAGGDATGFVSAARALLGLGPGLTPSGDDCLVGWLAGLWADGPDGRRLLAAAAPALLATARERTGALSRAFLAAALAGQAGEPLRDFVAVPDAVRLGPVLALGATSGGDLLAGYCLARVALAVRA
jgi:Protein of unknown function (DUF2877)